MTALSDYLEVKLLEHSLGKTAYTMPSPVYVALFTSATTDAGGGTEVTGGGYARQSLPASSLASAVSGAGTITTTADIVFPVATASWGTVVDVAIYDAATAGNMLWHGSLTVSKAIGSGDQFKIAAGQLTLTLA